MKRPGNNLFEEVKRGRGRPPKQKESQEGEVMNKLKMFTNKDQERKLARFADMLDLLTFGRSFKMNSFIQSG